MRAEARARPLESIAKARFWLDGLIAVRFTSTAEIARHEGAARGTMPKENPWSGALVAIEDIKPLDPDFRHHCSRFSQAWSSGLLMPPSGPSVVFRHLEVPNAGRWRAGDQAEGSLTIGADRSRVLY